MPDPTRVVVFSAGPGAGGDGVADELAAGLRRLGLHTERYVLARPGGPPWSSVTDAAVARAVGSGASAVVSAAALSSQVLGRLRARGTVTAPVVTYLADAAVHPLAVAPGVDVHLAGHAVTARQARTLGAADVRVVAPPVRPACTVDDDADRAGLPAGRLALIVAAAGTSGSASLEAAARTSRDITATGLATPVISCGGDELLRRRVDRAGLGWVDDPAAVLSCDLVVQNAGGQASLEALTAGVPVLSYRCVPGAGRANAAALDRAGLVPWVRGFEDLKPAVERILDLPVPRVETAGPDAAEVIASLAGRGTPATHKALPVRRIRARRVRAMIVEALEHTVV
jgi:UDP-N-acetylglucosamine:LPS N-acetylglucosamine transferase